MRKIFKQINYFILPFVLPIYSHAFTEYENNQAFTECPKGSEIQIFHDTATSKYAVVVPAGTTLLSFDFKTKLSNHSTIKLSKVSFAGDWSHAMNTYGPYKITFSRGNVYCEYRVGLTLDGFALPNNVIHLEIDGGAYKYYALSSSWGLSKPEYSFELGTYTCNAWNEKNQCTFNEITDY